MFAENKAEYNWLRFLDKKCMAFNKTTNPNGKIKNHLFYLTKTMQFFYICDFLTDLEEAELIELANKEENSVIIGYSSGKFGIIHDNFEDGIYEFKKHDAFVCQCKVCGNWWFGDNTSLYDCKACSAYSGDHYLTNTHFGTDKILFEKE